MPPCLPGVTSGRWTCQSNASQEALLGAMASTAAIGRGSPASLDAAQPSPAEKLLGMKETEGNWLLRRTERGELLRSGGSPTHALVTFGDDWMRATETECGTKGPGSSLHGDTHLFITASLHAVHKTPTHKGSLWLCAES